MKNCSLTPISLFIQLFIYINMESRAIILFYVLFFMTILYFVTQFIPHLALERPFLLALLSFLAFIKNK